MRDQLAKSQENFDTVLLAIDPHEEWGAKYLLEKVGLNTDAVKYPLLLDPSQTVSASYGVAFQMRVHVEVSNRPATFIIDRDGILRYGFRGKTYSNRPPPAHIKVELKKLAEGKE